MKDSLTEIEELEGKIVDRLQGRIDNSNRTFMQHPDPRICEEALLRARAYKVALADVQEWFGMWKERVRELLEADPQLQQVRSKPARQDPPTQEQAPLTAKP